MRPYKNNDEYINDMQKLTDLRIDALIHGNTQKSDGAISGIRAEMKGRAALTKDVFLPIERVILAFELNELEEHLLFTLLLFEKDIAYRRRVLEALKLKDEGPVSHEVLAALSGSGYSRLPYYNFAENCLENRHKEIMLRKEIIYFTFNAEMLVKRVWKDFYLPFENTDYFSFSDSPCVLTRHIRSCFADSGGYNRAISVFGAKGSGRRTYVKQAAYESGIPIHFISCKQLLYEYDFERAVDEIIIESVLTGSVICLVEFEHICDDGEKLSFMSWKIRSKVRLILITTQKSGLDLNDYGYYVTEISVPDISGDSAAALWEAETRAYCLEDSVNLRSIADMFRLTPAQIKQAAQNARDIAVADDREKIGQSLLAKACRNVSTKNISLLGKTIESAFGWDDLILPPEQKQMLKNAIARVKLHRKVFTEWGFERKTPYGAGVYILLYGPPGTGKTMAAQVMSNELGLSVYKIDLSSVVSKYIGETEKSLNMVFEESLRTNCILFFDEADALFGKRTEIKDSHDRHANLQVSFLLQKIEEHSGVVLLATNLDKNFDDAFKRRLHYVINFPMPGTEQRRIIWENVFPAETPVDSGVDFEYLAEEFRLSGGSIKNIALSAAFRAAACGKAVGLAEIFESIREEAAKTGGALPDITFEYGCI